jgi:hypothetical protein
MEILLLLGLGALILYGAGASTSSETPAQSDLKRLFAANPTTAQAVTAVLGNPNPARLNQYAAQLYALYPALAKQLGDMALSLVTKVTGKSGTEWYVWVKSTNGTTKYIDVMSGSMPVITYTDDQGKRTYLSTYPGVDAGMAAQARSDFV